MGHVAPIGSDIAKVMFETCTDALDTGILVFSKNDHILTASRNAGSFFPVSDEFLKPGTSLRAFLIALFEIGAPGSGQAPFRPGASRDKWVSERIAAMWQERGEQETRIGRDRVLALTTRRLASGLGILMARDISAHRKMEERWRSDLERVVMTEEILDNLPSMLFVVDRNLKYVAANKAYGRFHGVPSESLLDRRLVDVADPEDGLRQEAEMREVLASGKAVVGRECAEIGGEQVLLLTQRFRLGNPGNYFVVTLMQQVSRIEEGSFATPEEEGGSKHAEFAAGDLIDDMEPLPEPLNTGASTVILLSSDAHFGRTLNEALHAFRFDACHADSLQEVRDIADAARDVGIEIDLIMADDADVEPAELANIGVKVLPISRARPVHFAVAEAAAAVTHRSRSVSVEIDTDYLPEFPEPDRVPELPGFDVDLLVVEDNPVNQEVYAQILGSLGISYELAKDGAEALRLWDILRPSLVLMDLELPDISGCEVARQIRDAEDAIGQPVSIVGVMPKLSQEKHEKCLASGMDETIVKPLSVETIEALYKRHMLVLLDKHEELVAGR
ncbi:PAS domain S-box-containing protein [Ensifer adhaerens]|nr:PAS domain S-box-containing protein [Ensifer adhaerens]